MVHASAVCSGVLSLPSTSSWPSADVWSVGCIMAELLTGQVLFLGGNGTCVCTRTCRPFCTCMHTHAMWPTVAAHPLCVCVYSECIIHTMLD